MQVNEAQAALCDCKKHVLSEVHMVSNSTKYFFRPLVSFLLKACDPLVHFLCFVLLIYTTKTYSSTLFKKHVQGRF